MTARDAILSRVREALRVQAPRPGSHGSMPAKHSQAQEAFSKSRSSRGNEAHFPGKSEPPDVGCYSFEGGAHDAFSRWLPAVGDGFSERVKAFADASAALRSDFHMLEGAADIAARLQTIREAEGWRSAASHRGELTDVACAALGLPMLWTDSGYDKRDLERCDVGITACDALIAQTGSVLVTGRSAGGRALSVLPRHHLVIARRDQIIADLPAAFELLRRTYAPDYPSFISLISGPSRTGDIERILVLGAHGPKKLTIVCA